MGAGRVGGWLVSVFGAPAIAANDARRIMVLSLAFSCIPSLLDWRSEGMDGSIGMLTAPSPPDLFPRPTFCGMTPEPTAPTPQG